MTAEDEYFPLPRELRDLLGPDAIAGDRDIAASDVLADLAT